MTAAVLGSADVFKIDLLWPIIARLQEITGKKYEDHIEAKRVIADHVRGAVFMAADGVVPSNTAAGYVMRRLVRRAIRRGHELGAGSGLLAQLVPVVIKSYADYYPELKDRRDSIINTLQTEEDQFRRTLERGLREFEKRTSQLDFSQRPPVPTGDRTELTGKLVFTLFDTYGFPVELSLEEAKKEGVEVEQNWREKFDQLMSEQKERSRPLPRANSKVVWRIILRL